MIGPLRPGHQQLPRMIKIIELISLGHTNKEIATEMKLATGTIKTYINAIMQGLDANNRAHIVLRAYEKGLLKLPPKDTP